jgi:hypothetical protein
MAQGDVVLRFVWDAFLSGAEVAIFNDYYGCDHWALLSA